MGADDEKSFIVTKLFIKSPVPVINVLGEVSKEGRLRLGGDGEIET